MKYKIIGIILLLFILGAGTYFLLQSEDIESKPVANFTQAKIGDTELTLEIADTPEKRELGLSGRKNLPEKTGMLFVFPMPSQPGFWMKDMKFALDFIWLDQNLKVAEIIENISPETYPEVYIPQEPIQYMLELTAGDALRYNIEPDMILELNSPLSTKTTE